jgi:hypothetical protein
VYVTTAGLNDFNRSWRTTAAGAAPVAADRIFILGEYTGQADPQPPTGNSWVVTKDDSVTTDIGKIDVGKGGTLRFKKDSNTKLRTSGSLQVWDGGVLNTGEVGAANRIQSGFVCILELNCTAEGQYGIQIRNGGTWIGQGNPLTNWRAKLAADYASGTTITTDISTGWTAGAADVGDLIAIASTARYTAATDAPQSESRRITGIAGAVITLSSALGNAHAGVAPTQAEVINLSRNVKIRAVTAVEPTATPPLFTTGTHYTTFLEFLAGAIVDLDWVQIHDIGAVPGGGYNKRGVDIGTTTGTCGINNCAIYNGRTNGVFISGGVSNNITFEDNVLFNLATVTGAGFDLAATSSGTSISVKRNVFMQRSHNTINHVRLLDCGFPFQDNCIIGGYRGLVLGESVVPTNPFSGNIVYSCVLAGISIENNLPGIVISGTKVWRCGISSTAAAGIIITSAVSNVFTDITFSAVEIWGCSQSNIMFQNAVEKALFLDCLFHGGTAFATVNGIAFGSVATSFGNNFRGEFYNCDFGGGAPAGKTTHTNDLNIIGILLIDVVMVNCRLGSATEILGLTLMSAGSAIRSARHDQTAAVHKTWQKYGIVEADAAYYKGAAPSEKLTPNTAGQKVESSPKRVAVANGQACAISAWVRKSSTYNGGAEPRLMMRRYDAAAQGANKTFYAADQVINTFSGAGSAGGAPDAAAFQQLAGTPPAVDDDTVLEFFVDAEGTAGTVHVEDWSVA